MKTTLLNRWLDLPNSIESYPGCSAPKRSVCPLAEVRRRCAALGISNVHLLSALPNRTALDAIGATDCGIFGPQLVFDEEDPTRVIWIPSGEMHLLIRGPRCSATT